MSVKQYVQSMVDDCEAQILAILGEVGPLTYGELRAALRMEQHVAQAIIDRALTRVLETARVRHCGDEKHDRFEVAGGP